MRVAFTHPRAGDLGGVERQAHSLAVALCDAGHEVHYFCERSDASVDPRIRVHHLRRWLRPVKTAKVWLFDRRVTRAVARAGPFDVVQGFGKTSSQDVYYDGSGCQADFQAYALAQRPGGWRRALARRSPYRALVARIEDARYTPGRCRRIVAISEQVRGQILSRHPLRAADVEVVHPGVDLERFAPAAPEARARARARLGIDPETPLLVFLGNDYRRKGLDTTLRALRELSDAQLLVMGSDAREARYREQARRLGVAPRVHWLGARADPERWLGAGDLLVFPSRFDPFGSAVLEALACGLPAVVSGRAGAAELIEEGRTGAVLGEPEDASALARAVRPYLEPSRRGEAGGAARKSAEARGWSRHAARMLEIYAELGAGGVSAGGGPPGSTGRSW